MGRWAAAGLVRLRQPHHGAEARKRAGSRRNFCPREGFRRPGQALHRDHAAEPLSLRFEPTARAHPARRRARDRQGP